jgi:hypothetical protein
MKIYSSCCVTSCCLIDFFTKVLQEPGAAIFWAESEGNIP